MLHSTTKGPAPQSRAQRFIAKLLSVVLTGAALLLIAASAGLGTYFGYETGKHVHWLAGFAFAVAALGGEILKPFAMAAAFDAFGRWQFGKSIACASVAVVCVAYSLAGELALSAGSRGDLVAKREGQGDTVKSAKASRDRAEAELSEIAKAKQRTRSVAELEAIIARTTPVQPAPLKRKGCASENGTGRWVCPKAQWLAPQVHPLAAELGRARRKAELETIVAKATAPAAASSSVGHADPLATAIAHYARAAGYQIEAQDLSIWLYLIPVLFIEIGSAFGIVVSRAAKGGQSIPEPKPTRRLFGWIRRNKPPEQSNGSLSSTVSANQLVELGQRSVPRAGPRPMSKLEAERFVVTQLALKRELTSQDWLADKCRVSKSTASEWLSDWEKRGLIFRARVGRRKVIQAA